MFRKLSVLMLMAVIALAAFPGVSTSAQATTVVTLNAGAMTGGAHVIKADIVASNGVVHVIDSVLVPDSIMNPGTPAATMAAAAATMAAPAATMAAQMATMAGTMAGPTIADIVVGNPDFSTLLAALKATGLVDMFTKPGTYTVFAPNNKAFDAAMKMMGITSDQLMAEPALVKQVLTYHVLGTVVMAADLVKLTKVTTLEGEDITVSVGPAPAATMAGTMAAGAMSTTLGVTKNDKLGSFLVGPDGKTLYTFKKDTAGVSTCADACAKNWPPLTVAAGVTPSAAAGISGKIATITRADGTLQVTYNGLPLYYFLKDAAAGDTNGQGVGSVWFVAAP